MVKHRGQPPHIPYCSGAINRRQIYHRHEQVGAFSVPVQDRPATKHIAPWQSAARSSGWCRSPARPFPSSIFLDKNRRDIGKSQSIYTDSKTETAGSRRRAARCCAMNALAEWKAVPSRATILAPHESSMVFGKDRRDIDESQSNTPTQTKGDGALTTLGVPPPPLARSVASALRQGWPADAECAMHNHHVQLHICWA
jgi:hypothetical protein